MRWVVIGVASLLVGLLVYGVASQRTSTSLDGAVKAGKRPGVPSAERLPELGTSADKRVTDFKGKVVLVNFWASWCEPCKQELPLLQRAQKAWTGKNATVLGINMRDASTDALDDVNKYGLTYPSLRDGSGDYADKWAVTGVPESFVLDRRGRVAALIRGPLTQQWLDAHVTPLVNQ
jgi:cytochrome c biogenesis protein CcmG/thiol:disulfide interchange protein DsbE